MLLNVERARAGGEKLADKPGFCRRKLGGGRIGQRELQAAGPLKSLGQAGGQLKDICSPVEKPPLGKNVRPQWLLLHIQLLATSSYGSMDLGVCCTKLSAVSATDRITILLPQTLFLKISFALSFIAYI